MLYRSRRYGFFFFNDTATTEIYTLSLHDALPISNVTTDETFVSPTGALAVTGAGVALTVMNNELTFRSTASGTARHATSTGIDRKSTRLNSSHANISYAVFCLKKKKVVQSEEKQY